MNRLLLLAPALLGLAFFAGCSSEPEYVPPAESIPTIAPGRSGSDGPAAGTPEGSKGGAGGGKIAAPPK